MSIFLPKYNESSGTASTVMSWFLDTIGLLSIVGLVSLMYVWGVALGFS